MQFNHSSGQIPKQLSHSKRGRENDFSPFGATSRISKAQKGYKATEIYETVYIKPIGGQDLTHIVQGTALFSIQKFIAKTVVSQEDHVQGQNVIVPLHQLNLFLNNFSKSEEFRNIKTDIGRVRKVFKSLKDNIEFVGFVSHTAGHKANDFSIVQLSYQTIGESLLPNIWLEAKEDVSSNMNKLHNAMHLGFSMGIHTDKIISVTPWYSTKKMPNTITTSILIDVTEKRHLLSNKVFSVGKFASVNDSSDFPIGQMMIVEERLNYNLKRAINAGGTTNDACTSNLLQSAAVVQALPVIKVSISYTSHTKLL